MIPERTPENPDPFEIHEVPVQRNGREEWDLRLSDETRRAIVARARLRAAVADGVGLGLFVGAMLVAYCAVT